MTEAEWLACEDPDEMLGSLPTDRTDRKLRLFACACCRRIRKTGDVMVRALDDAEEYADGRIGADELARRRAAREPMDRGTDATMAVVAAGDVRRARPIDAAFYSSVTISGAEPGDRGAARVPEQAAQAALLRDIFGNPFRPVTILPEWRTSTVLALAEGAYESRDFTAMPILADALQDAGCDDEAILTHCRWPGPHARGCTVIDALTGRS